MILSGVNTVKKEVVIVATTLPSTPKLGEMCVVVGDQSTDRGFYVCFEAGTWVQVF